jgi:DNA-binding CsgD family transcriptional regulator
VNAIDPTHRLQRIAGRSGDSIPQVDDAYPIVAAILRVVPATRWTFARVSRDGVLENMLYSDEERRFDDLATELHYQREIARTGPRIATTLVTLGDLESGVTLVFANARATFGILTILRARSRGPFTSSELSMLTLALYATSERLLSLRVHADDDASAVTRETARQIGSLDTEPSDTSFYILDRDLQIVLGWSAEERRRVALTRLHSRAADRLPALLEETVRELTCTWSADLDQQLPGVARPVPFLVVRTDPMTGPTGLFIGVRIDRFRPTNSLDGATARYHISPREVQVLSLLLDGEHLAEIGTRLHITSSTVQDHIRSLVEKTGSRNRSDLIARVLGWDVRADAAPA